MSEPTDVGRGPLDEELVRFVRSLRRAGASVPANAASTAARALAVVGLRDRDRVRTALRASLLSDADDFETFDRLFEAFWRRLAAGPGESESASPDEGGPGGELAPPDARRTSADAPERSGDGVDDAGPTRSTVETVATGTSDPEDGESTTTARYSPTGSQSDVGGPLSLAEDDLSAATRSLRRTLAGLQGRHFEAGSDRADVRRALRTSVSSGGAVLSFPERERRRTAMRALLFVDVSRSVLDTVDRGFLIDFLRQVSREWRDARVFLFDEDAREVTEAVDASSRADALAALEAAEEAWGGGTRIGASLRTLRRTAADAVDRRTAVFVVSDGLEMGGVDVLERELSWLARRAKRVLWLNPLAAGEAYEPTARGMAAALPYLDGLFAFSGPEDVTETARQLRQYGLGGRVGHEFGTRGTAETHRRTTTRQTERP